MEGKEKKEKNSENSGHRASQQPEQRQTETPTARAYFNTVE